MRAHRLRLPFVTSTIVFIFSTSSYAQQATPSAASSGTAPTPLAAPRSSAMPAGHVDPPAEEPSSSKDVYEKPGKAYYFVGARYRGTVIPKFLMNIFVDGGKTIYSNTFGAELDIRKDGFSFIPSITYTEYGTGGDVLFLEKGKPDTANNWSLVNSSLKGLYLNADLLWSTKVHRNVDFEYGVGVGLGVIFGSLVTNWVYEKADGPYQADNGKRYASCNTENDDPSSVHACTKGAHSNSSVAKVNQYEESSWVNGGSKPNLFIHLAVPQIGVRIKPVKEVVTRLTVGFSLTGFFFGLSANYGLEKVLDKKSEKP
ncbi:hypothetical protein LZC95_40280 [Pendulispora brunnea]|uniref:Uncharacterized protein n=1 Tax=Pendulispora brunnea TaxID=2905690 RepID=A0ABZ2K1R6_9BACT